MEATKKLEDPETDVCPELSNHQIFEKWRIEDTSKLKGDKLKEFNSDKLESNRRYDAAFGDVVRHTSKAEISAFFEPFGVTGAISFTEPEQPAPEQHRQWSMKSAAHTNDAARPTTVNPIHRQLPSVGLFNKAKKEETITDVNENSEDEASAVL
jgi:hypothetical protein